MATIQTEPINKEHIKFRWAEPYASDASNVQMGINDTGAYKGATLSVSGGTSVTIADEDGECLLLHRDPSDGISTVIRVPSSVVIDLSTALTWPIPSDISLYFFATTDYQINQETTGLWQVVDDVGDIPAGAVRLGTIELSTGATGINDSDIRVDGDHRDRVLRKKLIRIPRRQGYGGGSPITRFIIPRKVYFMGDASWVPNKEKIGLRGLYSDYDKPLMGSDGGEIVAGEWYPSEVSPTPLTLSDMDDDVCYTNPWIEFDFSDTSDSDTDQAFSAIYFECVELEEMDNYARDFADIKIPHSTSMYSKEVSDYPDSLTKGTLISQLIGLLSLINDRIKSVYPEVSTGAPFLLWRSNNVTSDAGVDEDTISIYFNTVGIFICHGCYMTGSYTVYVQTAGHVRVIFYENFEGVSHMHREFTGGEYPTSLSITNPASWDSYEQNKMVEFDHSGGMKQYTYEESASVEMDGVPDTGDNEEYIQMFDVAGGRIRAYWGGNTNFDSCRFFLTFGCYWDDADSNWKPTAGYGGDWAFALSMENDKISIRRHDLINDLNVNGGWTETNWTTSWEFHDGDDSPRIDGKSEEKHLAIFKVQKLDCHIRRMIDPDWVGPTVITNVPSPLRRGSAPNTVNISQATGGTIVSQSRSVVGTISRYGVQIEAQFDVTDLAEGVTPQSFLSTPTRIRLPGTGYNIGIGQWLAIRSPTDSNEGAWCVKDIAVDPSHTTYEIEVDYSGPSGPSGTVSDETVYFIKNDEDGDELYERVFVTVSDA